jgi:hypothetical protein
MSPQQLDEQLDLSAMTSEERIVFGFEVGYPRARKEVKERARVWKEDWVVFLMRRWRMKAEDVADAQQQAWVAVEEGLEKYRTEEVGKKNGCKVKTFLEQVVMARMKD